MQGRGAITPSNLDEGQGVQEQQRRRSDATQDDQVFQGPICRARKRRIDQPEGTRGAIPNPTANLHACPGSRIAELGLRLESRKAPYNNTYSCTQGQKQSNAHTSCVQAAPHNMPLSGAEPASRNLGTHG